MGEVELRAQALSVASSQLMMGGAPVDAVALTAYAEALYQWLSGRAGFVQYGNPPAPGTTIYT